MASGSTRTRPGFCARPTSRRACVVALLLAGLVHAGTARGEDWVLAMSAALSRPSASLGIELYRGARAYLDAVDAQGGVHGRRLIVRARDDVYDPAAAIANTIGFLEEDDVLALFNYVGTPTTTRILPLLQLDAVRAMLLLFPFAGAQPLRGRPYSAFLFNLLALSYAPNAG